MNNLFVCGDVAMRSSEINQVVLLEGGGSVLNFNRKSIDQMFHMPRVVINGNHVFETDYGLEALNSLVECGYLASEQGAKMKERFQAHLDSFALIFPSESV